jgi:phosphatidylglycerophosphate synthase
MARHTVILATDPRLLAPAAKSERQRVDYTTRVGGVGLLKRAILSAAKDGAHEISVLVGSGGGWLHERLASDPSLPADLTWYLAGETAGGERAVLADLKRRIERPFLLLRANRAYTVDTLARLRAHEGLAPVVSAVAAGLPDQAPREAGLYVCEPRVLDAALAEADALSPLEAALVRLANEGKRAKVDLHDRRVIAVSTLADREAANDMLLTSLIKPHDGVVSKNINRKVSLALTRRTMNHDVFTPNLFTTVALVLGVASAFMVATGSYLWIALGGLFYQLASIIDGNDGEIARLKFQGSKFGGWFDTVADDVTNLGFILGLGFGTARLTGHVGWLVFAVIGVSLGAVAVAHLYAWLAGGEQTNTFDVPWSVLGTEGERSPLQRFFALFLVIGKRDFYALLFAAFCLLGLVQVPLLLGATTTTVMGLIKLRESLGAWLATPPQPVREATATGLRRR